MAWASTPPCSPRSGCFLVSRKARTACFTESSDVVSDFPWGRLMKSRGFHQSAGAHWRRLLFGKRRHPVGFSSAGLRPLVLIGGGCRRVAVMTDHRGGRFTTRQAFCWSSRFRSWLPVAASRWAEPNAERAKGMPMPTSVLRKQAQPGGRKRSARAANGGLDGRRERQASGRGCSRAAAGFMKSTDIVSIFP